MLWRMNLGVLFTAAPELWGSRFVVIFQHCQEFGCPISFPGIVGRADWCAWCSSVGASL